MEKQTYQNVGTGLAAYVEKDGKLNIDNININRGLMSKDLLEFAKLFLLTITRRDWKIAALQLEALTAVDGLDAECKKLLEVLNCKLLMQRDGNKKIKRDVFLDLLRSSQVGDELKDIIESIYIYFLYLESPERAKVRYLESTNKLFFCRAVYLEFLADVNDLEKVKNKLLSDCVEIELCSYIRLALRLGDFEFSQLVAIDLDKSYKNFNSEVMLLLASSYLLHEKIHSTHFWLLESNCYEDLNTLIKRCLELHKKSNDVRIIHASSVLLAATWLQSSNLLDICLNNIDEATKVAPKIKDELLSIDNKKQNIDSSNDLLRQRGKELSVDEFSLLLSDLVSGHITKESLISWAKHGRVEENDDDVLLNDFLRIVLCSFRAENLRSKERQELEVQLKEFVSSHQKNLKKVNAALLHVLCIRLIELKLSTYIIQLVKELLPSTPWASPLIEDYAHALLETDQYRELELFISSIANVVNSPRLLSIQSQSEVKLGNYQLALEIIKKTIFDYGYKKYCYLWAEYLRVANLNELSLFEMNEIISDIPKDLFLEFSEDGLSLVFLISQSDASTAAEILLNWFINDPDVMAKNYTDFWFSGIIRKNEKIYSDIKSNRCSVGFVYSRNGTKQIRLLIDEEINSRYLLDSSSELAIALKEKNVGEKFEIGFDTYEVVEKLPPFVAALRASIQLRLEQNIGNDSFYQFEIKDDNVESIFNVLDRMGGQDNLIEPVIDDNVVPLLLRLNRTHKHDLVRGSFAYLENKESNELLTFFSKGYDSPNSLVVDVLSFVYLCMTGFSLGIISKGIKLYITKETQQAISFSLRQITDPDYLSLAKSEDGYVKTTAGDIQKMPSINNMITLLEACEIVNPQSFDMPMELARFQDLLDYPHYSSVRLALSNGIPLLCLDHVLCSAYEIFEVPLVNVNIFFSEIKKEIPAISHEHIVRHVLTKLPVPISYKEIIDLCGLGNDEQYWASKILLASPGQYESSYFALDVLARCYINALRFVALQMEGNKSPINYMYSSYVLNTCCRVAMQVLEGKTCEQRVALLIYEIFFRLRAFKQLSNLAEYYFYRFIKGHFLSLEAINSELTRLTYL